MKNRRVITKILAAMVIGAPFLVPLFSPWSRINCECQEVDISSGRRRITRFIYWIPIFSRTSDTLLSRELAESVEADGEPQWRSDNTFGPYTSHSPHHNYHGASNQIQMLAWIWEEYSMGAAERSRTGRGLLEAWQTGTTDTDADLYLDSLRDKADQPNKTQ